MPVCLLYLLNQAVLWQVDVKEHWHPRKRLIKLGQWNPADPDEAFLFLEYFDLPGEDVAQIFQEEFGTPLPMFDKKVRLCNPR